ncbi:MAG: hypothetical protein UY49_C0042G0007 [Microgenomates group bacterium GW2011_GWC1_49_7]|nr:MAG: hypothetical protein UY49_C0042G0007 [Microgenomates group bacterium GW2011_GWC1_49_7]
MSWLSYVFPQVVARYSTPYNKDIRVVEEQRKYKLLVNGARQSGEFIKSLWQEAFAVLGVIPSPEIRSILVLGVAGGTVIHLLREIYPNAVITAVDIDERMIEIGKKYFSLSSISGLTLTVADARNYVMEQKKKWDLVVIDLYIGATIPPFVGEEQFLRALKTIMTAHGILLINYLYELEYRRLSDIYLAKLQNIFSRVIDTKIHFNRFFFVVK